MRGYQKKVIFLKNTGSPLFEEAYFVIKSENEEKNRAQRSTTLIEEANKIIEENINFGYRKRKSKISKKSILIFLVGFISASLILLLAALIFKVI